MMRRKEEITEITTTQQKTPVHAFSRYTKLHSSLSSLLSESLSSSLIQVNQILAEKKKQNPQK